MRRKAGLALLAAFSAIAFWPWPATERLYLGNGDGLRNKTSGIIGAVVPFPMDPSFYYRFEISPVDLGAFVVESSMRHGTQVDAEVATMQNSGPMFWNRWWWRPDSAEDPDLYLGCDQSGCMSLLYDRAQERAFVMIQNT